MKNIQVHYEIFIFDLSKMLKTMNIHFNFWRLRPQAGGGGGGVL